jgi:ABC-type transporter Mla subunit MlaD
LLAQDDRLAERVGAIALGVLALAIAGVVFFDRVQLGSPVRIRVLFHHVAGLRERAPLVVAGQPVGRVESIAAVPHGHSALLAGEVGVAVTIAVDDDRAHDVPAAGEVFVASRGPLADRYLEVAPPRGEPGPAIRDGLELRGVDPPSLDDVLQRSWNNMVTFQLFVATIRPELDALIAQIRELQRQLDALPGDVPAVIRDGRALASAVRASYQTALGGEPGLAELRTAIRDARSLLDDVRATIARLGPGADVLVAQLARVRGHLTTTAPIARVEQILAALRAVADKLEPLLATTDELGQRLARGEGSLGRLMTDPEFSDDAKAVGKFVKRHPWKILERPAK